MKFRKLSINGHIYGDKVDKRYVGTSHPLVNFHDSQLQNHLRNNRRQQGYIWDCLVVLSVCHSVICEQGQYIGSSPDELAMVHFAQCMGFVYEGIDSNMYFTLCIHQNRIRYKLLHTLHYTSERKRMSVIIQDKDGNILLLCKGADSVIFERASNESFKQVEAISKNLSVFGREGLRTLVMAQRSIPAKEYFAW